MHDPLTVAFQIKYPWRSGPKSKLFPNGYRNDCITIWHKDPERGGSDDSCGWFKRAHHGDKAVLAAIIERFDFDWDRVYTTKKEDHEPEDGPFKAESYLRGYFAPNGDPRFSASGITLNLFLLAGIEHFGSRDKAAKFIQKHLFEILLFAENPSDSLYDTIHETWGKSEKGGKIRSLAEIIYGCILRWSQPWYQHPRWHIQHWRIQIHPWQDFRRWAFDRCAKCGKGFKWREGVIGEWSGKRIWHDRCDNASVKN